MIKRIFTACAVSAIVFSCGDNTGKAGVKNEKAVTADSNAVQHENFIYFDTVRNLYNLLCQDWVMEDDADALSNMTENSKFEVPYRSFYLAANGTFIKNPRNDMEYGNWRYNDLEKTVTFNYGPSGSNDVYKIAEIGPEQLKMKNMGTGTGSIIQFISSGKRFNDPYKEPFFIENNRWRIPPVKIESDTAIRKRLKENIHFFILIYKSILAKEDKIVSFWGLPSCFKWYGGGIFLKKKADLKENWINCFYNREQAMEAYALAERLIQQKYVWPKGESNWLKQNLAVLEQIHEKIDEIQ